MEAAMTTWAIDGVRWINDRVTHVRWGRVDATTNSWTSPPTIVDVSHVVDAIKKKKEVRTLFILGGRAYLGPKVVAIPYATGHVGIEAHIEDGQIEKTLEDLPVV
jgi:hypothetical protein